MNKRFCNICSWETEYDDNGCVYHQAVLTDSEGVNYLRYEEFDQDGN